VTRVTNTTGTTVAASNSPVVISDVLGSAIPENNSRILYASLHFYILYSDKHRMEKRAEPTIIIFNLNCGTV